MRVVYLEADQDAGGDRPNDWGGWQLVSFARHKFITDKDPELYIANVLPDRTIIPIDIGLRRKLETGTAFWLSYFEHSEGYWSLLNEGTQCQWDTAWLAGILIYPGKVKDLPKTKDERAESARNYLEVYNDWANGHIYYYCVEDEEGNDLAACGGYFDCGVDQMFKDIAYYTQGHEVEFRGDCAFLGDYHKIPVLEPVA